MDWTPKGYVVARGSEILAIIESKHEAERVAREAYLRGEPVTVVEAKWVLAR